MQIAVGSFSRFFLVAWLGSCAHQPNNDAIADAAAAPPVDSVSAPAPTFADPAPTFAIPLPGSGPYQHPIFRERGEGSPISGPRGRALIDKAEVSGSVVANADRVIAGMRAALRACYNRVLPKDPEAHGSLRVVAELSGLGEVTNATAESTGRLNQELTECVLRRVRYATFAPPESGHATVRFSVTFDQER